MTNCRNVWRGIFALMLLLITGCSSAVVTGSWKSPDFKGQVKKIYIVGIAKQDTTRRIFEDDFRKQLAAYGVTGITSYNDLPAGTEIDKAAISAMVKSNGADSVLMTRAIGERTEQVVNPGRISGYGYGPGMGYYPAPYYRTYGSYYARSRDIIYEPATVSQYQVLTIEANLYSADNEELIWSAQLESVVEGSMEQIIDDLIESITKNLKSDGLI